MIAILIGLGWLVLVALIILFFKGATREEGD